MSEGISHLIQFKRQVLQALRHTPPGPEHDELKQELRVLEKMVTKSCSKDKSKYFATIAAELQRDGEAGNFKQVYARLGRLSSKRRRQGKQPIVPLPQLLNEDGAPVGSFQERQEAFFRQFSSIEAADIKSAADLVRDSCQCPPSCQSELNLQFIPTMQQICGKLKKLKRGRAPGPDQIMPDVLKAGGIAMAHHLCSVFAKGAILSREPLQWKTGILVPLFKKGSPKDPGNFRSI